MGANTHGVTTSMCMVAIAHVCFCLFSLLDENVSGCCWCALSFKRRALFSHAAGVATACFGRAK